LELIGALTQLRKLPGDLNTSKSGMTPLVRRGVSLKDLAGTKKTTLAVCQYLKVCEFGHKNHFPYHQ
jgi:hypothetical protein